MAYTDLHFHLLPGIDDGPRRLEQSVELARAAVADGTATIVATPHVSHVSTPDVQVIPELVREVSAALRGEGIPIDVRAGAELAHYRVGGLSQAELEVIANGPPGRRWLLLEASLHGLDENFTAAADELRERGFAVVVAHPERAVSKHPAGWEVLEHELAAGSAVQVNAWSLAGRYGDTIQDDAVAILRTAPAAVVASDAHSRKRPPALGLAREVLAAAGDAVGTARMEAWPALLLREGLMAGRPLNVR